MPTLKYALRYLPLLLVAVLLLFLSLRLSLHGPYPAVADYVPPTQLVLENSPYREGATLYAVAAGSTTRAWAVGGVFGTEIVEKEHLQRIKPEKGIILAYDEGKGTNWQRVATTPRPLFALAFANDHDAWAVGYGGSLVHYNGSDWKAVAGPANTSINLYGVAFSAPDNGWAVGQGGTILHYDGAHWTRTASPTRLTLRGISIVSAQEAWCVGDGGTILHLQNGTWHLVRTPTTNDLTSVTMLSADEGWAIGSAATVLHYRGERWNRVEVVDTSTGAWQNSETKFSGIAMVGSQNGWIIYQDAYISGIMDYEREIWGPTYHDISPPLYGDSDEIVLNGITMANATRGWIVGRATSPSGKATGVIYKYTDARWIQVYKA